MSMFLYALNSFFDEIWLSVVALNVLHHTKIIKIVHEPKQNGDINDWCYEEQFKRLYDLDTDINRKPFLDELFIFMHKRGKFDCNKKSLRL